MSMDCEPGGEGGLRAAHTELHPIFNRIERERREKAFLLPRLCAAPRLQFILSTRKLRRYFIMLREPSSNQLGLGLLLTRIGEPSAHTHSVFSQRALSPFLSNRR